MKLFTNLPGTLRGLFGLLRLLIVVLAAFWFFMLTFGPWIQKRFVDEPKMMVSIGEADLRTAPGAIGLHSDSAKPGSLALSSLRGRLQVDLLSDDPSLASALRQTTWPVLLVFASFWWLLFSALRAVCANIERGEVFSENNLRLVRRVGVIMIGYSFVGVGVGLWVSHVMGGYLAAHISLTGLNSGLGAVDFGFTPGQLPAPGGLVPGCLVLVLSEAFRQGLALKTENDLTV